MDVLVEMAIDLACQLQEDERYLAVQKAQAEADADAALQDMIGEFNLKRMAINQEESKPEEQQDTARLRTLNTELRDVYGRIMQNPHMDAYNEAKTALDTLVNKINAAVAMAVQGKDPHLAAESSGCSGKCSACGGCH